MTLDEIRKLIGEATPGPWRATSLGEEAEGFAYVVNDDKEWFELPKASTVAPVYYDYECAAVREPDARLIAAARTLLPALLEVAEKARDLYEASYDCLRKPEDEDDAISQMGRLNDTCAATGEVLEALEALKLP